MPIRRSILPAWSASSSSPRSRAAFAAGEDRQRDARGLGQRRNALEVLPREDFGRRHDRRLMAGFDHVRGRQQRHDGLARAHVALQQPQHARPGSQIAGDFLDRLALRACEREGQRSLDLRTQPPVALAGPARLAPHLAAHQRERELVREQFVIGEPCAEFRLRRDVGEFSGNMQPLHRLRERSKALLRAKRRIVPFGHLRHELECGSRRAAHVAGRQALGERIDRIEIGKIRQPLFVEHPVRVHHLQPAVVERDLARHPALFADREHLFEPLRRNVEIDDLQRVGVVLGEDAMRRAPAAGLVPLDRHFHSGDRVGYDFGELRPRAPVDGGIGQVE